MLKQASIDTHPAPACQDALLPEFVLGSSKSSTYLWERVRLGGLWVGQVECRYATGFNSPAALLDSLFEHLADSLAT